MSPAPAIACLGAGRMARGIAVVFAYAGHRVTILDVKARTASVSIAGSGDVELQAGESLSVEVSGSGDVRYRGEPRVTQSIAGSGSVERD